MEPKRSRGRPKGSVIPTDWPKLEAVADLMQREPKLRPTTAIKRIVPEWTDSIVHRLLGKWRKSKETLMSEARRRQEARANAAASDGASYPASHLAKMHRILDNPAMRMAREIANSPAMRMAREIAELPAMRMMREIENSPTMRMMRELENSPTMQAMRELQNNAIMQMTREQECIRRSLGW